MRRSFFARLAILTLVLLPAVCISSAQAEIFYDLGMKGIYEDNVVGLLSDRSGRTGTTMYSTGSTRITARALAGPGSGPGGHQAADTGSSSTKSSDTSVDFFAVLGGSFPVSGDLSVFLSGNAELVSYSTFTLYNATLGGLSVGFDRRFGAILTARLAATGAVKRFEDDLRNASSYCGALQFKERLHPSLWLKQGFTYEKNSADSPLYSYSGSSAGIWAGYVAAAPVTLIAGYTYLQRRYDEPSGFQETANTVSLGLEWQPVSHWFLDVQYDHRGSDTNLEGTRATDNIVSIGIRFSR
jgi:opacity protein-like surface antigen